MGQHEEYQYIDTIKNILENGDYRVDRTKVGTLSIFGVMHRYSLANNTLPLLTTKYVNIHNVIHELLWIIGGKTNANELAAKGVNIWKANGTRAFLDKQGLTEYAEGDLGPIYGFQWRHSGANYINSETDYSGQGIDQLANVIQTIKTNAADRRMIINPWNPSDLKKMALPPCHCMVQFYVSHENRLSCLMTQRSADMGLGVPYNIASYALLTHMVAKVCNLEAYEFIHSLGDTHVYMNHVEPLKKQILREPRTFPTIKFARDVKNIDDFKYEDFIIKGYNPHASINMPMAV